MDVEVEVQTEIEVEVEVIEVEKKVRQTTIRGEKKIGRGKARDETRERTGAKGRQR